MGGISTYINKLANGVGTRLKGSFYLYLAALFSLLILADALALHITGRMRQTSFDMMIRHRLVVKDPDPDIVIVDINEASLAAMAMDYGRWPWPREVMGEFLENVERQKPRAVVFDIMFSDPDIYNPDSDAYFNDAVAATDNTYFPVIRLDPESDGLSDVRPEQIPGVTPVAGKAEPGRTVAVVLPFFDAAIKGGRLGLNNIYPDEDGISRRYTVYRDDYGWLIPSLPARVAGSLGSRLPDAGSVLINWRGGPFTYPYAGFSDVFLDMTSKEHKRPGNEFAGKVVIIGSTAAGLMDVKATPVDRLFPGVEILATAMDNLKNGDYLREPDMRVWGVLLSLLIVWATAIGFYRNAGQDAFDRLFGASQFLLIGISFAGINLFNTYINLTGPVMVGVAYFSCARLYAASARKALEKSAVMSTLSAEGELYAALMLVRLGGGAESGEKAVARMRKGIAKRVKLAKSVEVMKGVQKGIWGLFEGVIVVSWTCPAGEEEAIHRVAEEAGVVEEEADTLWRERGGRPDSLSFVFHEGRMEGGERSRDGWSALFGEALSHGQVRTRRPV